MQTNTAVSILVLAFVATVTSLPLERSKRQALDLLQMMMNPMAGMGMMGGGMGMNGMTGMNAMAATNPMLIEDLMEPCEASDCLMGQYAFTRNRKYFAEAGLLGPFLQAHARAQQMNAQRMAQAQARAGANAAPGAAPPVAPPAGLMPPGP